VWLVVVLTLTALLAHRSSLTRPTWHAVDQLAAGRHYHQLSSHQQIRTVLLLKKQAEKLPFSLEARY
jgi:hypothetical protein